MTLTPSIGHAKWDASMDVILLPSGKKVVVGKERGVETCIGACLRYFNRKAAVRAFMLECASADVTTTLSIFTSVPNAVAGATRLAVESDDFSSVDLEISDITINGAESAHVSVEFKSANTYPNDTTPNDRAALDRLLRILAEAKREISIAFGKTKFTMNARGSTASATKFRDDCASVNEMTN